MASPRVFVSSTCYDLKYIRENLKYFIRTLGYEPILSEEGDVYYSPSLHTHDACISEVQSCQMMVLIIGGRYGGEFRDSEKSITNHEYEAAVAHKIPIFALVDSSVLNENHVYSKNRSNKSIDENSISYPSTDDVRVFSFIDQVRKHLVNNAIVPFKDFSDMETYLRKQWAGMMYEALTQSSEAKRLTELFESLKDTTKNVQFMTRQLVNNIENKLIQLNVEFYDHMLSSEVTHDLSNWRISVAPKDIVKNRNLDEITDNSIEIDEEAEGSSLTFGGPPYKLSKWRYERNLESYQKLRNHILLRLEEEGVTSEQFLEEVSKSSNS